MSARDYGVLMRSSAEITRSSTNKIHGDNLVVLTKAINFVGRSLQNSVLNNIFVTAFEGISRKKGVKLRVSSISKILRSGNQTLLEIALEKCSKHESDAASYHDIIHAVMEYLRTHRLLLDQRFLKDDTYRDVTKIRSLLASLDKRYVFTVSRYVRLCKFIVEATKYTKVSIGELSSVIAPTLLSLPFRGFSRSLDQEDKNFSNLVKEANQAVKRRNLFVRYLLQHYDEIFEDAGTPMTPGIFNIGEVENHIPHSPCTPSSGNDSCGGFTAEKVKEEEKVRAITPPPKSPVPAIPPSVATATTTTTTSSDVVLSDDNKKKDTEPSVTQSTTEDKPTTTITTRDAVLFDENEKKKKKKNSFSENKSKPLTVSVAPVTTTTTTTKLMSRSFSDRDTSKMGSMRLSNISSSGNADGDDSSGSELCLSDEDIITKPHDRMPVVKEGYMVKYPISSAFRSIFNTPRKRYFRLTIDNHKKIAFLSYYKDNESEKAKGHLILAEGCHITEKKDKGTLRVTFYDDIKDAKERRDEGPCVKDRKHTLVLSTEKKDQNSNKILKSWADTIEKTISSLSIGCKIDSSIEEPQSGIDMTQDALAKDLQTGVMVKAGYDAPVRKRSESAGTSHQHGISIGKTLVSKKKRRLVTKDGFDLDLAYITSNIVAMGFPSTNFEGWFVRNNIKDVVDFFDSRHEDAYMIYNLCIEKGRTYDIKHFNDRVQCFPHFDHNPPPIKYFWPFCRHVAFWLDKSPKNVVAVHCKAGKGRTGVMICAYLLYRFGFSAAASMKFYAKMRTHDGKGVTLPSQKRFIKHFAELCEPPFGWSDAMTAMLGNCESVRPVGSTPLRTDMAQRYLKSVKFHNCPDWMLDSGDHLSLEIISGFWTKNPRLSVAKQKDMFKTNKEKGTVEIDFITKKHSLGVALEEEVKFVLYYKGSWSKKKKRFYFWIHAAFVDSNLVLTKKEVDGLHKDKKHKKVPKSFLLELNVSKMTKRCGGEEEEGKNTYPSKSTKTYVEKIYKDDNDYSFRQGITEAEKLFKTGLCTEEEMTETLKTLDMARYVRVQAVNSAIRSEAVGDDSSYDVLNGTFSPKGTSSKENV